MNEVEKKGIGKAGIGILILAIVAVVLTTSNLLVYVSLSKQISTLKTDKKNLNIQVSTLQTEKSGLVSQVNSLKADIYNLQEEIDDLESEIDSLQSEKYALESDIDDLENEIYDLESEIEWLRQIAEEDNFQFYYVKPEEQKFGVYNLDDELDGLEWTEPYQAGVFDCSEMSACLEWFLENRGWHVKIYLGDTPFGSGKHAWLIVETTEGKYMPVESTTLRVIWWSDPNFDNYWNYDHRFETIQDAIAYSESGYDWWELGFSPLED